MLSTSPSHFSMVVVKVLLSVAELIVVIDSVVEVEVALVILVEVPLVDVTVSVSETLVEELLEVTLLVFVLRVTDNVVAVVAQPSILHIAGHRSVIFVPRKIVPHLEAPTNP